MSFCFPRRAGPTEGDRFVETSAEAAAANAASPSEDRDAGGEVYRLTPAAHAGHLSPGDLQRADDRKLAPIGYGR